MIDPELDNLFRDLLASNSGPGYGVAVRGVTPDRFLIEVEVRFLAGRSYCCAEPFCHLPWNTARLLELAAERGVELPESVVVGWHCYVEAGARLEVLECFGLPAESAAYDSTATTGPCDAIS